jgi:hypothetical protein
VVSRPGTSLRAGVQVAHARQTREDDLQIALVTGLLKRFALFARPLQTALRVQAPLQLAGQLE